MVLRRGEFGIEYKSSLEVGVGFVTAVEDGEEKPIVLYAGGVGVESGGLLPGGKCAGSVTSRAGGGGLGFQVAELLRLLGSYDAYGCQQENQRQARRPVPQQSFHFLI